jgi:hypothetical protein
MRCVVVYRLDPHSVVVEVVAASISFTGTPVICDAQAKQWTYPLFCVYDSYAREPTASCCAPQIALPVWQACFDCFLSCYGL